MSATLGGNVHEQRDAVADAMAPPLAEVAQQCVSGWGQREALDEILGEAIFDIPHCRFLYALAPNLVQVSSNVSPEGLIESDFRRDRSTRPYTQGLSADQPFTLSESYISLRERRPSITAIQRVMDGQHFLGYLGADFALRDLPFSHHLYEEPKTWRQLKGDPSIRSTLFAQTRTESLLDQHMDTVFAVMEELFLERGMFQGKIHFASSRATVTLFDEPYNYRILEIDALIDPDICMAFPLQNRPERFTVSDEELRRCLQTMRELRLMDDTLYLRSGHVNMVNGMVSLTFSCDGSHYMSVDEFLEKDLQFWEGQAAEPGHTPCG